MDPGSGEETEVSTLAAGRQATDGVCDGKADVRESF